MNSLVFRAGAALSLLFANPAFASPDWDRQYAMESVAVLPSQDNSAGIFRKFVADAMRAYFEGQSRFIYRELGDAELLLTKTKSPFEAVIMDREVLGTLSRAVSAESLIRTRIRKEGTRFRIQLDWLHHQKIDTLATHEADLDPNRDDDVGGRSRLYWSIARALDGLIAKVPFRGQVRGRERDLVVVDLGHAARIKKDDVLQVATIENVKVHPISRLVSDWTMKNTGTLRVETVDGRIAFCRPLEDSAGKIAKYQKIVTIVSADEDRLTRRRR